MTVPAKVVSNITFGGKDNDEIFITTGEPNGVYRAKVGVKGFAGHPGKPMKISRYLNIVPMRPHPDSGAILKIVQTASKAKLENGMFDGDTRNQILKLTEKIQDESYRSKIIGILNHFQNAAARYHSDQLLLAE